MDIQELKYFLMVAKEENLTKAASYLYITQPSLTRQIQNLEKEVGGLLFNRTGKKMILTEQGLFLKKRAEEIVALYDKMQSDLLKPTTDITGDIYIGSGETYSFTTIISAMQDLNQIYPDIHFHITSANTTDVLDRLDKGLIDFGVVVEPCDLSKYEFLRLPLADTWGVLTRRDSVLATKETLKFSDLDGLPLLISRHILLDSSNDISKFIHQDKIVATYNLIYNASLMVDMGLGHAITLDKLINTDNKDLIFIPFEPKIASFVSIAWKKHQVFSNAAKAFLKKVQEHLIHFNYNSDSNQ